MGLPRRAAAALPLLACLLAACWAGLAQGGPASVRTVFPTDCKDYFNWQTVAMVFSWRQAGQPGSISRVMSCTDEEAAAFDAAMLQIVPSHIAPSYAVHPKTQDPYTPYNKPVSIMDWMAHEEVAEEWVLVLDADMLIRRCAEHDGPMQGRHTGHEPRMGRSTSALTLETAACSGI